MGAFSVASPVTPETLFQIGSLTRTYIGTAIWRLIDEGALSLDASVRTHLPDLTLMDDAVAAEVTVANLLDHSAGWYGDKGFETGNGDDAIACYVAERLPQLTAKIGLLSALIVPPDAPTVTVPAEELAEYAGQYADPSQVMTFTAKGEELEGSTVMIDHPGVYQPAILPPAAPPAPVTFLARDMAVVNGSRLPFVGDVAGRVQWVSSGLRLVPRVEADA
jgi:Beta-lactamase